MRICGRARARVSVPHSCDSNNRCSYAEKPQLQRMYSRAGRETRAHLALGNVLLGAHPPPALPAPARVLLALLRLAPVDVEHDVRVARVVDVEQVRVELDVAPGRGGRGVGERGGVRRGGARGRGEGRVGEDLDRRVGLGARECRADRAQDVALGVCLRARKRRRRRSPPRSALRSPT